MLRDTLRDRATQQGALPSLLGDGDYGIEIVYSEEKIFRMGPTRAAKAAQKSVVSARQTKQTNQERTPFICPHSFVNFNSQQGPLLSRLSDHGHETEHKMNTN
jgi:hypothetical protein